MKYRIFGKTGSHVSEIGFGCWAIGGNSYGTVKDEESLEALQLAYERGVNFFDTADIYGQGHSEEILSKFLKKKPRDRIFIASKVGFDFYHGAVKKNFDANYIRFACESSLKRLKVEAIDIYQLHNPSVDVLGEGNALETLQKLQREGKIRFMGVSVHSEEEALRSLEDERVQSLQVIYNLIDQRMAHRVFGEAYAKGVGIIAREPLACGMLTGKYPADHEFPKNDHRRGWRREQIALEIKKVERLKTIIATDRLTLPRAALEFVLDNDYVSTVIPGMKRKEQVYENLSATEKPELRPQESSILRNLFTEDPVFSEGLR